MPDGLHQAMGTGPDHPGPIDDEVLPKTPFSERRCQLGARVLVRRQAQTGTAREGLQRLGVRLGRHPEQLSGTASEEVAGSDDLRHVVRGAEHTTVPHQQNRRSTGQKTLERPGLTGRCEQATGGKSSARVPAHSHSLDHLALGPFSALRQVCTRQRGEQAPKRIHRFAGIDRICVESMEIGQRRPLIPDA